MKQLIPKFQSGKVLEPKEYFSQYLQSKGAKRIINNAYKWMDRYYSNPWNQALTKLKIKNNSYYGGIDNYKYLIPKAGYALDNSTYYYTSQTPHTLIEHNTRNPRDIVYSNPTYSDASMYGTFRKWDTNYTDAHEYGHVFTSELPITRPVIDLFGSVVPYIPGNEHDSRLDEKYADLEALRYQLYKTGIYDSRSDKNVTPEHIQKMRNRNNRKDSNIFDRLLESELSNEKIAEMLNNIVSTGNKQQTIV